MQYIRLYKLNNFDYENNMICSCCKDITAPNGNHDNYINDITRKINKLLNTTKEKAWYYFYHEEITKSAKKKVEGNK